MPVNSRVNSRVNSQSVPLFTDAQSARSDPALVPAAMTELEKCMESLIMVFHRYANDDGDKKTLTKKELKKLLETELPNFLTHQQNTKAVDNIMNDLDVNKDHQLDFEEFLPLVAGLSVACERCYNVSQKKGKK